MTPTSTSYFVRHKYAKFEFLFDSPTFLRNGVRFPLREAEFVLFRLCSTARRTTAQSSSSRLEPGENIRMANIRTTWAETLPPSAAGPNGGQKIISTSEKHSQITTCSHSKQKSNRMNSSLKIMKTTLLLQLSILNESKGGGLLFIVREHSLR